MSSEEIIAEKDAQIESLKFRIAQLEKLIFGVKSERFISTVADNQLNLFDDLPDAQQSKEEQKEEEKEQITYERKKAKKDHPGRHPLPDHLPVKEERIEPEVDTSEMIQIGEEVTDTLEYEPASLFIKRTIRPKYVDPIEKQIHIGSLPTRPIPKAIAEASLLAHILVSKFVDHLPYYRQIQRFDRDFDWKVSKSTINDWVAACCALLRPLYEQMKKKILLSHYIQADESPIKVLDSKKKGSTHQGYQWVYYAPTDGVVVFHYRKGRGKYGPKELLMQYEGYLQCDGFSVYDQIGKKPTITLIGCLAHARRKFVEAQNNDRELSEHALKIIQKIYLKERKIQQLSISLQEVQQKRMEEIKPLIYELKDWIDDQCIKILPASPIGKAMTYFQNQWPKLKNILMAPEIKLDNNLIENQIRPLALGRKNYLFAGSHQGAEWAAMMYSFFGTCKIHGVNPREWLTEVLTKIPDHNHRKLEELLPKNYAFEMGV